MCGKKKSINSTKSKKKTTKTKAQSGVKSDGSRLDAWRHVAGSPPLGENAWSGVAAVTSRHSDAAAPCWDGAGATDGERSSRATAGEGASCDATSCLIKSRTRGNGSRTPDEGWLCVPSVTISASRPASSSPRRRLRPTGGPLLFCSCSLYIHRDVLWAISPLSTTTRKQVNTGANMSCAYS